MVNIEECINSLRIKALDHSLAFQELASCYREGEYVKLLEAGENAIRYTVELYRLYRELLLSLYEVMPSVPKSLNVNEFCRDLLGVSVERTKEFEFPVYKITLPVLLPNKRKRKVERNIVITDSVSAAVSRFCNEYHITPFTHATVVILSIHQKGGITVDNDNLDSAVVMNSLNGKFIRDDRPDVCNMIFYSKFSKKAITEIFVVDSDHDIEVLSLIKSGCHKQIE